MDERNLNLGLVYPVAATNRALTEVAEAETRLHAHQQSQITLSEKDRNRLLELGSNLNAVWNDASAPVELKKRIIRTLINEIVVDVNHPHATIEIQIHWAGGVHTPLIVRKNKYGRNSRAVDRDVVELLRELALVQPESYIASTLNRLGYQTGTGKTWNAAQRLVSENGTRERKSIRKNYRRNRISVSYVS